MDLSSPKARTKDCRNCNRRRIKCDRGLPHCKKCEGRGLECTGYGVLLKWGQGVASRGHLTKLSVPKRAEKVVKNSSNGEASPRHKELEIFKFQGQFWDIFPIEHPTCIWMKGDLNYTQHSSPINQSHTVRYLLHHYNHIITANMVWTDWQEQDNPWRNQIMPMVLKSPALLNAVLAFASKHISAIANSNANLELSRNEFGQSNVFMQQALNLLAVELQPLLSSIDRLEVGAQDCVNQVLATMLVLINVETVWPDSSVWRTHLNGARTLLAQRTKYIPTVNFEDDTALHFLAQELFTTNTFASITNFQDHANDTIEEEPSAIFGDFLKILQEITQFEREPHLEPSLIQSSRITPSFLRTLFENARANNLTLSRTSKFSTRQDLLHFTRIVNSFYYGGLIYAHQVLLKSCILGSPFSATNIEGKILDWKTELFKILSFMDIDKPSQGQDLVWPLFIAGSEAFDIAEQQMVTRKLEEAMRWTGFSNCREALQLLNAFWKSREAATESANITGATKRHDWISFARNWVKKGRIVLVF